MIITKLITQLNRFQLLEEILKIENEEILTDIELLFNKLNKMNDDLLTQIIDKINNNN